MGRVLPDKLVLQFILSLPSASGRSDGVLVRQRNRKFSDAQMAAVASPYGGEYACCS
jgi:hypothetical protein